MPAGFSLAGGSRMGLALRLVEAGTNSPTRDVDVVETARPGTLGDVTNLGLTLGEAKQPLTRVRQVVVAGQARDHAASR